jgi:hypothetical protein
MRQDDNILNLLREKGAEAARVARRAVILQPGAIGDCVLTLPLAAFMKEALGLGGVDIVGHTDYIGILPGRTCVDGIQSIDSVDLHRLFAETKAFDLVDRDPLVNAFADYAWVVTFLGEPGSNFEQNLIFTVNCSHSAEVITLPLKPSEKFSTHISGFYIQEFIAQSGLSVEGWRVRTDERLIRVSRADVSRGRELLKEIEVDFCAKLVVIQPGSGGLQKCWHLENFLSVAEELCSKGIEAVFLLGPAELERFSEATIKDINRVSKCLTDLPFTGVLGLLSCADGFVGNDSGITHLAAALGVRTLAVFGTTNPDLYRPIGPSVTVFASADAAFAKKPSATLQEELLRALMA